MKQDLIEKNETLKQERDELYAFVKTPEFRKKIENKIDEIRKNLIATIDRVKSVGNIADFKDQDQEAYSVVYDKDEDLVTVYNVTRRAARTSLEYQPPSDFRLGYFLNRAVNALKSKTEILIGDVQIIKDCISTEMSHIDTINSILDNFEEWRFSEDEKNFDNDKELVGFFQ